MQQGVVGNISLATKSHKRSPARNVGFLCVQIKKVYVVLFCVMLALAVTGLMLGVFGVVGRATWQVGLAKEKIGVAKSTFVDNIWTKYVSIQDHTLKDNVQLKILDVLPRLFITPSVVQIDVVVYPFLSWSKHSHLHEYRLLSVIWWVFESSMYTMFGQYGSASDSKHFSRSFPKIVD